MPGVARATGKRRTRADEDEDDDDLANQIPVAPAAKQARTGASSRQATPAPATGEARGGGRHPQCEAAQAAKKIVEDDEDYEAGEVEVNEAPKAARNTAVPVRAKPTSTKAKKAVSNAKEARGGEATLYVRSIAIRANSQLPGHLFAT
jgi:hypothetical protein